MRLNYCFILVLILSACNSPTEKKESIQNSTKVTVPIGDPIKGKALYTTCAACHGPTGEGNKQLNAPALASGDSWYLYRQLMNFRNDIRGFLPADTLGIQMAAMAKTLPDSVSVSHVVAYIKTFSTSTPTAQLTGDIKMGERTYQSLCGSCHGANAMGNEKMNAPQLNGLDDWYLKRQLINFKNSIRGTHQNDTFGAQMIPMASLLTNDQAINDVIAYIHSTTKITH